MKKIFLGILTLLFSASAWTQSMTLADEDINYKIMYKWGLINSLAGRATLSLRNVDNGYSATLTARSEPWADRIYRVRDTLLSEMKHNFMPVKYEKIAHEDGKYTHDVINYSFSGNNVTGHCTRIRQKEQNGAVSTDMRTLSASGATVDMLSVFYYLRTLDFPAMKTGTKLSLNIFSGKKKELLIIKYNGYKSVEIDDHLYYTYHVSFRFTTDDGKKSSDDIETWISADNRRIPIKLEGHLPVGKIRCLFTK